MTPLERDLERALLDLWEKWKGIGPPKNFFLQMVKKTKNTRRYKGPVGTVRYLLIGDPAAGFKDLVRAGKVHWTMEALILEPRWKPLFTEWELNKAKARIEKAKSS